MEKIVTAKVPVELKRKLTLPLLTLYGLGVTIGAGIYVLVGTTAARAGIYAPISFLIAAGVVSFTGFAYAELSTRHPVSAGEAAYVRAGFNSSTLTLVVGLLVAASGIVSSAAVSIGAAAYIGEIVPVPPTVIAVAVILIVGVMAAWGILESVMIAAIFTLIEMGGLILVIYYGVSADPEILSRTAELLPPFEISTWGGIISASLLAFFAFVGFEDMANVAEEVVEPHKTLPRGIFLTLLIASILYFLVVSVVVLVVPMADLAGSAAPLALVFEKSGDTTGGIFRTIAIVATTNGVLIQIIMASRVLYGLAMQKNLPSFLASVSPVTRTPLVATGVVVALVLVFATLLPIARLAEATSTIVLIVFCFVNLALIRLKRTSPSPSTSVFVVPIWVPVLGLLFSIALLLTGFLPV
ncbi:amino acid permease [Sneathiella chungangensis]|uniref:Amino acid permease n=1 Tax=Sneathiella chungangensis TaxID=1418234 RepID=A0A845MGK7_9PROT|nr:amino acid permease [Sneathiella chungangensis]MZR23138.1 amino acid permease [Sneathiella chungangensis]